MRPSLHFLCRAVTRNPFEYFYIIYYNMWQDEGKAAGSILGINEVANGRPLPMGSMVTGPGRASDSPSPPSSEWPLSRIGPREKAPMSETLE